MFAVPKQMFMNEAHDTGAFQTVDSDKKHQKIRIIMSTLTHTYQKHDLYTMHIVHT